MSLSLKTFFVVWLLIAGFWLYAGSGHAAVVGPASDQGRQVSEALDETTVYLYFIEPDGRYLTGEMRKMQPPGDTAAFCRMMIDSLVVGPSERGEGALIPVLDPETQVLGVYVDDAGTAYVDLAKRTENFRSVGVRSELLSVYAIVNTLIVNIEGVDRVKILLGGNEAETFNGHINIANPVNANMLLVR